MPGINFLFWNVNRKPLEERIRRIVQSHAIDVVILAECISVSAGLTDAINSAEAGTFSLVPGSADELKLLTRLPIDGWSPIYREPLDAWLAFRIAAPSIPKSSYSRLIFRVNFTRTNKTAYSMRVCLERIFGGLRSRRNTTARSSSET